MRVNVEHVERVGTYRIGDADWVFKEWCKRRDVIVAAEREAEAARKAA